MNCLESMISLMRPIGAYSLREDSLIYAELASYYEGLRIIEQALAQLSCEGIVITAQDYGLREWERIIRSAAFENVDLNDRRQIVIYTLSRMPGDFNSAGLLRGLRSLGLDCSLQEDPASMTVTVTVSGSSGMLRTYEQVLERVEGILPAHVKVVLDIGIVTWDAFETRDLDFDTLDAEEKSWDEMELTTP